VYTVHFRGLKVSDNLVSDRIKFIPSDMKIDMLVLRDRLCGLVVRVSGYRSKGPVSIPDSTRIFLRSSGSGTGSTQPRDDI
jgi:hypothetical protein